MQPNLVIIFDGDCALCHWSARFIFNNNSQEYFKFASLQSAEGKRLLAALDTPVDNIDSIILIEGPHHLIKSNAVIRILHELDGWWSLFSILTIIPEPIRDWFYDLIARNRYKWFGEVTYCPISLNVDQNRVLD